MPDSINLVVEGWTDELVMRRVLAFSGLLCGPVRGKNGKNHLLKKLGNYNRAAQHDRWLVVVDLDRSADCAPSFIQQHLPRPAPGMMLRVAVRAVEAWLLADREHIAAFLGISAGRVPRQPDTEEDPKTVLINLARSSRKKTLREDIIPRDGSGGRVGPGYAGRIEEFLNYSPHPWRAEVAAKHSDSLNRCLRALENWRH